MRTILKRTITKFFVFVISVAALSSILTSCSDPAGDDRAFAKTSDYLPPRIVGRIANHEITESSGIAASKCAPDVFWTHNDSGDDAFVFAIDETGRALGTWKVTGAENLDWEDIAALKDNKGVCYLYVGDIGDNEGQRAEHKIYRFREPTIDPELQPSNRANPHQTEPASVITFVYPDGRHDAETLLVHPMSGDIYVLTKRVNGPAGVYRIRPAGNVAATITAEKVGDVKVPAVPNGLLTGGDISGDGKRIVLCDYTAAYEFSLPDEAGNFDEIWKQNPSTIDLGKRKVGEAVCYSADGLSVFATSERKDSPFIRAMRK